MRNTTIFFSIILLPLVGADDLFCQGFFENLSFTFAYARHDQDKRLLYEFPSSIVGDIKANENSKKDREYAFYVQKRMLGAKRVNLNVGLGYSNWESALFRPFNHTYFTGRSTYDFYSIQKYTIHNLLVPVSLNYDIKIFKHTDIILNLLMLPKISVNREAEWGKGMLKMDKWKVEFNNLEINPGIGVHYKGVSLGFNYRLVNFAKKDRIIFGRWSYGTSHPEIFEEDYETYNIKKIWVTLGYAIGK